MNTTFKRVLKSSGSVKALYGALVSLLVLTGCKTSETFYSTLLRSDVYVQEYDDTKFDFLWVVDNSGSMLSRRQFVRDNMQSFIQILNSRKAVDFQMAVTTTDMFSHAGALVEGAGGVKVVKSASSANASADFASIIDAVVDSPTSFWEQGLEASYQAVLNHKSEFSRPGVPLIVIYVTDEDDFSCMDQCFGVEPENNPNDVMFPMDRYKDYFANVKKAEKSVVYLFPIIGIESSTCTVASDGARYEELATEVGDLSASGSICSGELRQSYEAVAQVIADRGQVFRLSVPASGAGIKVFVDSELVPYSPDTYRYDAATNAIYFTGFVPRSGSVIEVTYSQLNE